MTQPRRMLPPSFFRHTWTIALALPLLCAAGGAWAQSADMLLAQHVVTPDPVPAGGVATITMTVQNNGPNAAANVVLTDTIPPGSTFVGLTASGGGTCTGAPPYACTWPSVPYPGTRTATLLVRLPTATVWPNSATITSDTTDPNPGNNGLTRNITAVAAADLALVATTSAGGPIAAGTPYTYTLAVNNNAGPDPLPAGQVPTVKFNIPIGSTVTALPSGTGWTCTPASPYPRTAPAGSPPPGPEITCTRTANDGLAVGASYPPITVPAVANVTGSVAAAFTVSSDFPDGNITNNTDTVSVTLGDGTDMSITKTAALAAGGGGTQATFTLTPRQQGGMNPTNVTVVDDLPVGLNYVSHTAAAPWSCSWNAGHLPNGRLTCTMASYTGGPFTNLLPITLVAQVVGTGDIPNTGAVAADQPDPVGGNNTSTITVNNSADLGITKTASVSPVVVGQAYNWNITVRNYGPMPVLTGQTITVTDTVPPGMTVNGPASAGWTCTGLPAVGGTAFSCDHVRTSNLAVNTNAPTLSLPSVNTAQGAVTNNACLALSGSGPTEAGSVVGFQDNCVGAGITTTDAGNSADLQITKAVAPNPVVVGQNLTYTLVARNLSATVAATNVHVYDTLNNLVGTGSLQSITTTQGSCTPAAPANGASQVVDCNLGTLAPGGTATVTITVRPNNTTAAVLSRPNTASVNSLDVGDPNRTNNSATVNSDVLPRVDATVSKTVNPSSNTRVGQPTVYTVTARNAGPSTTNLLRITDVMPPNTAFISVGTPSNSGTCGTVPTVGSTGETLVCDWTNVPAGGNRTVQFTVRPLIAALNTTVHNVVNVSVGPMDTETDTTNNSNFADTNVIDSLVDILVQKTDSVDPVVLGGNTMYTVTVRNAGPSIGTNLVVTDTFPNAGNTARFSYQGGLTATVAGAAVTPTCTEPAIGDMTGQLRCTFPTIAVGIPEQVVLTYLMRAESITTTGAYSGTQGNRVVVGVDENETEMANNEVIEDTSTRRDPPAPGSEIDLGIVKTASPARALPGTEFDYTLTVTNLQAAGSGRDVVPGNGAQVTDTLPAGLSFVSAPGCTYAAATRQVVCIISNLAAGANTAFTLRVRVDTPYLGPTSVPNTAHVDMPGDPVPGNNDSTVIKPMGALDPTAIPTLSEWGLILLSMLLAGFALRRVSQTSRRRL